MDIARTRQLAGIAPSKGETTLYRELTEVVEIPQDVSMEELSKRMDACKRALSIATTMQNPEDKKKWVSACFVNLNKVRGALQRMMKTMGVEDSVEEVPMTQGGAAQAQAPAQQPNGDGKFMIGSTRI